MNKLIILFLITFIIFPIINISKILAEELKSLPNNFLIVVGDKVNVRAEADKNAKIIETLPIGWRIQLLKRTGKKEKIGDIEGEWVYVDTGHYENYKLRTILKGWVFDYYLADLKDFKKVTIFIDCKIEGWVGDYLLSFEFNKDASYVRNVYDNAIQKVKKGVKGKIYGYRKVIYAQDDDGKGYEFFYFTDNGVLCSPLGDEKGKPYCCQGNQKEIDKK